MVGALSIVAGSSIADLHTCQPCIPSTSLSIKGSGRKQLRRVKQVEFSSSFVDAWDDWRLSSRVLSQIVNEYSRKKKQIKARGLVVVSELAGQYEDSFDDVKTQILNYFTYKAARTVLNQLYEMNPTQYRWFYSFLVTNKPSDGKRFIRVLNKENQELAERVMVTRLHLYGKWIKKCDHAAMYKEISDQNLELMRERLIETIIWPSDDTNSEKIG